MLDMPIKNNQIANFKPTYIYLEKGRKPETLFLMNPEIITSQII
jgi:hypothetical protein